ncbi:MAG TPA: helix-turn-helix domain-containing protein [Actinotalea sp.]
MADRRVSAYRTLASESRVEILHVLQQHEGPLTVDEVGVAVGLHVNTAREHLDRLVESGFVAREAEVRKTRGRPRILYRSVDRMAAATMDVRAREHLTRMLVEGYGRPMECPSGSAEAEGRKWADELLGPVGAVAEVPAARRGHPVAAVPCPADPADLAGLPVDPFAQLVALEQHFEDLGFDPYVDVERMEVHLRRCPLGDLAHQRTDVVCSVHLGLARGVLARQGGAVTADSLEPFVEPRHCVLHLGMRSDDDGADAPDVADAPVEHPAEVQPV